MRKFDVRWFRTHDMLVSKQLPKFMSPWQWRMDLDDVVWREVSQFFKSLEEQQKHDGAKVAAKWLMSDIDICATNLINLTQDADNWKWEDTKE